jgi:hypothetical protein
MSLKPSNFVARIDTDTGSIFIFDPVRLSEYMEEQLVNVGPATHFGGTPKPGLKTTFGDWPWRAGYPYTTPGPCDPPRGPLGPFKVTATPFLDKDYYDKKTKEAIRKLINELLDKPTTITTNREMIKKLVDILGDG